MEKNTKKNIIAWTMIILVFIISIIILIKIFYGCYPGQFSEWIIEENEIGNYNCEDLRDMILLREYPNVVKYDEYKTCKGEKGYTWTSDEYTGWEFKELYKRQCVNTREEKE